jgi:predicted DNA-binding antitoxin AbrB/MazE fold protein
VLSCKRRFLLESSWNRLGYGERGDAVIRPRLKALLRFQEAERKFMATVTCRAIFENGVFRPTDSLSSPVPEGQAVRLTVEARSPDEILKLVGQVYEGLSEEQIAEVESIALERADWFGRDGG